MDENEKPPRSSSPSSSGLELDRPFKSSPSNPRLGQVRSAMRDQPLAAAPRQKLDKAAIKEGALDTLLNSVSILVEIAEDFRTSDRFFKYKAGVLVAWLVLSVTSVGVACGEARPTNDINAALVMGGEAGHPIYLVKNESVDPWQDVEVVVNGTYRATLAQMEANGGSITLSPVVLFDSTGARAPADLVIADIVVSVSEPAETVTLLKDGVRPQ